jgi:hypothetical protein
MRAILICPFNRTITPTVVAKGIDAIYDALSPAHFRVGTFQIIDLGLTKGTRNTLYIDDDAHVRKPPVEKFFALPGYPYPIAGRGLILGTNRAGNSCDTTCALEQLQVITFPKVALAGFEKLNGTMEHPVLGRVSLVGQVPVFRTLEEKQPQ